jgi:acyl carrier protein
MKTSLTSRSGATKEKKKPMADEKFTDEQILEGLAEIVEEVAGVEADEVTADKSFVDDLDIDSLSMVEIAVQAEDRFEVKIPDAELANLKTVGDAVSYVSKNL